MPDISESLKNKLQEIKDKKDRRQKNFNIYFYVQLALNVLIDVALVYALLSGWNIWITLVLVFC
jgi:putative Mn2+ efflux pump MntP